jgi:polyphosphate kinase
MRWPRLATARHLAGAAIARLPVRSPLTLRLMTSALVEAARAGKEVTVVIELRARFEEEANIELANDLQEAGAHVVYGVVGHKTHAKMILVVRREDKQLRRYVHLGTGNYHARTARLYTDYGLFICDTAIGEDVHKVLQQLTALGRPGKLKKLLQSPFTLHKTMLKYIEREAKFAQEGKPARIARQCHVAAIADNALHAIALLDRCHKGNVAREVRLSKIPELVRREGLAEP